MEYSQNGKEINSSALDVDLKSTVNIVHRRVSFINREILERKSHEERSKRRINGDEQSRDCTTFTFNASALELQKSTKGFSALQTYDC